MPNVQPPPLDLFGEPDINFLKQEAPSVKVKKTKSASAQPVKEAAPAPATAQKKINSSPTDKNIQQAFLPGLSRRGRPRSKHPISAVERTAQHRRKRLDQGSKRVEMILAPEVARQLDALALQYKEPRSEVIATLVIKAYAKFFKSRPPKPE